MLIDILLLGGASLAIVCFIIATVLAIKVDKNPALIVDDKIRKWRIGLTIATMIGIVAHVYTLINTENILRENMTLIIVIALVLAYICYRWLRNLRADND